ncbi:hypothetical protein ACFQ6Q_00425 [Streptomyces sp. NPDC056437]|uniref:hypothetical protein n=1 Tax=Streptomyces sp. NPDC056437 TaxID=3345816 RepID=UPI0036AAE3D9
MTETLTPDELADRLDRAANQLGPTIKRKMTHAGALGKALIQRNASGRPGPNIINSEVPNYHDSWKAPTRGIPYGAECTIGTDKPQGMRLEFGFTGIDSIGRSYAQPPFAHVGPAVPIIEGMLRQYMRQAVQEVFE